MRPCARSATVDGELDDILAITAAEHLEGIVCKRIDGPYEEGRRSGAWLKHKHRRREIFDVSGWAEGRAGYRDSDRIYVSRADAEGTLAPPAWSSGGDGADLRAELLARQLSPKPGRRFIPVEAGIRLEVDFHGPAHQQLRDPIIRKVLLDPTR